MGKTHDAVLLVRLPADLLARVRAAYGGKVSARVRLGLERDLRERDRKRSPAIPKFDITPIPPADLD